MKKGTALIALVALVGLAAGSVYGQHSEIKTGSGGHPLQCQPSSTEAAENAAVFQQLNQYRQAQGRSTLSYDALLEQCIEAHCHHMSVHGFFAHNAPEADMKDPWTRARACGTSASGENIARGQRGATAVMNGWKSSPGHNANMLNGNFTRVGVGYYAQGGPYWGQLFGTGSVAQAPQNNYPPPGGGGGGGGGNNPPPTGGNTPPANPDPPPDPNAGNGGNNNPPPPTITNTPARQYQPPPKKIVPAGLLKK
jgi:uncharacterized protein YkwD